MIFILKKRREITPRDHQVRKFYGGAAAGFLRAPFEGLRPGFGANPYH